MKKYKVDSISKFLAIIENENISDYIYRGQNEPYFSIIANGFRPYMGGWNSDEIYDMDHLHQAFHNRIIGQLTPNEKEHFLAFCQHHGIPTNLVDISYSPLVALFFACDGKREMQFTLQELIGHHSIGELEKDSTLQRTLIPNLINKARKPFNSPYAQTYMVKKERLINITDLIVKLNGKSLFEEALKDEIIAVELLNIISGHFKSIDNTLLMDWLKNILNSYLSINETHGGFVYAKSLYNDIKKLLKNVDTFNIDNCKQLSSILESNSENILYKKSLNQNMNPYSTSTNQSNIGLLYTIMLVEILAALKNFPRKINIDLDIYFTYQPPELFTRISSQQSLFIYQPYLLTNDGVYDYCELNVQSINPDIIIEIDKYNNILHELNLLGINNGTIYGDIDNIAKSILKSSGRLLKV